jgi:hypothetical protein
MWNSRVDLIALNQINEMLRLVVKRPLASLQGLGVLAKLFGSTKVKVLPLVGSGSKTLCRTLETFSELLSSQKVKLTSSSRAEAASMRRNG